MQTLFLLAALTWPPDCLAIGELYEKAAMLRDTGVELEKALKRTPAKRIQLALRHVYEEPDMTPRDWKWFAVGICVEAEGRDKEKNTRGAGAEATAPVPVSVDPHTSLRGSTEISPDCCETATGYGAREEMSCVAPGTPGRQKPSMRVARTL